MYLHNPREAAKQELELAQEWYTQVCKQFDWSRSGIFIAARERVDQAARMYRDAQKRYG